jgi:predicted XRE-type DNA-binding protein
MAKTKGAAKSDPDARVTTSSGNVFTDLGFAPGEAAVLALRADLMGRMRLLIEERGWSQVQAAEQLGIGQSRVSDLVRGKWEKFSLDMLITLAARAGKQVKVALA